PHWPRPRKGNRMSASPESPETPSSKQESTYVMDPESSAEMERLMDQDRLITASMGGIFPEQIDLRGVRLVVDLGCGPGGWALEVAGTHPEMKVVGVDISERSVAYAATQAEMRRLTNASFRTMDILKPLDFADDSFDLVNARTITGFM